MLLAAGVLRCRQIRWTVAEGPVDHEVSQKGHGFAPSPQVGQLHLKYINVIIRYH